MIHGFFEYLTEESTVYTFLPGETIARDLHHSELQAYSASKKKKKIQITICSGCGIYFLFKLVSSSEHYPVEC